MVYGCSGAEFDRVESTFIHCYDTVDNLGCPKIYARFELNRKHSLEKKKIIIFLLDHKVQSIGLCLERHKSGK